MQVIGLYADAIHSTINSTFSCQCSSVAKVFLTISCRHGQMKQAHATVAQQTVGTDQIDLLIRPPNVVYAK